MKDFCAPSSGDIGDPWRGILGAPPSAPTWQREFEGARNALAEHQSDAGVPFIIERDGATVHVFRNRTVIELRERSA